jgi:hypothetical protein
MNKYNSQMSSLSSMFGTSSWWIIKKKQ